MEELDHTVGFGFEDLIGLQLREKEQVASPFIGNARSHHAAEERGPVVGGDVHAVGFGEALPLGVVLGESELARAVEGSGAADFIVESFLVETVPVGSVDWAAFLGELFVDQVEHFVVNGAAEEVDRCGFGRIKGA